MRRLPALLCGLLAVGTVPFAVSSATAGPATELCTLDATRGGVPQDFVLDACADAGALTLRNDQDFPVVVRANGDVGAPLTVHADDSATAEVLELAAVPDTLLMPDDVVRWPLGAGAAQLVVGQLPQRAEPAVLDELSRFLPSPSDPPAEGSTAAFAELVGEIAAGVEERGSCVEGKNFLRLAACDVRTSTTIGHAVFEHLPRGTARDVWPLLGEPRTWDAWHATAESTAQVLADRELRLSQTAVAGPPALVPEPVGVVGSGQGSTASTSTGGRTATGTSSVPPAGRVAGTAGTAPKPPSASAKPGTAKPAPGKAAPAPGKAAPAPGKAAPAPGKATPAPGKATTPAPTAAKPTPTPAKPAPAKPTPTPAKPTTAKPTPNKPGNDGRGNGNGNDGRGNGNGNNGHGQGDNGHGNNGNGKGNNGRGHR